MRYFLIIFLFFTPLVTYIKYDHQFDIHKLLQLIVVNLFSLIIVRIVFDKERIQELRFEKSIVTWRFILILVVCLFPFFLFLVDRIKSFDIQGLASFAISYRQGLFKGSGVYTFLSIQVLPLFLAFGFYKGMIKMGQFILGFGVVTIVCFVLGLRIFLYPLVLVLFIKYSDKFSLYRFVLVFIIMLMFVWYKIYLGHKASFYETSVGQITRPDLHAIVVSYSDMFFVKQTFTSLPIVRFFFGESISSFKDVYIASIPFIKQRLPFIRSYQGVAIPGYVLFFNTLNVLAVIPLVGALFLIKIINRNFKRSGNVMSGIFYFVCLNIFVGSLIEDVGFLYRLESIFIIYAFSIVFVQFAVAKS